MFLSQIELELRHPSVQQALRDCNDMHRNLMYGFPEHQVDDAARNRGSVLYRIQEQRGKITLLLTSGIAPDREALAARGFVMMPDSPKDISSLEHVLTKDKVLRFELVASPCKKMANDQKNSRRVFLRTEQERAQWLVRKATHGGFEIMTCSEYSYTMPIEGNKGNMRIHFDAVRFVGVLRIVDPLLFWQTYCSGIGPGKAYGLGLLTVARA